jgi:hypothetical protein
MNSSARFVAFFICFCAFAFLGILLFSGCANQTPAQQAQTTTDIAAVADAVGPIVASYAATGKVSSAAYAQAIPGALYAIDTFAPSATVATSTLAPAITAAVTAATGGTSGSTGQKIAKVLTASLPPTITGAQASALVVAAGNEASAAANPTVTSAGS